jgi:hypothetical protein
MCIFGICEFIHEEWFLKPQHFFEDWGQQPITSRMFTYYNFSIGYYIMEFLVICMRFKPLDKHNQLMLVHHAVTLILLFSSYTSQYFRIGIHVNLLHDLSDPFLEAGSILYESGFILLSEIFMFTFALVFYITRLLFFPVFCLFGMINYFPRKNNFHGYVWFLTFLSCVFCMDVYWSYRIAKSSRLQRKDTRHKEE